MKWELSEKPDSSPACWTLIPSCSSCLARRMRLAPGFTLAVQGSVLQKVPHVREVMLKTIEEAGVVCQLAPLDNELTRGAWYYAKALDR